MDNSQNKYSDNIVDDGKPWYAIRLYSLKLDEIETFFHEKGMETFSPKQIVTEEDKNGRIRKSLKPVVRNLIFVKKDMEDKAIKKVIYESNFKMSVFTKAEDKSQYSLIPSEEMYEFRLMCNLEISLRKFISSEEAQLKEGEEVYVKFGLLKGLKGKLVRSSKKYYLLKEIPGIGVMMKVTKWCCVPLSEMKKS